MSAWNPEAVAGRTRRKAAVLVAAVLGLVTALIPAVPAAAATVTFAPGAARTDQNGKPLQMHGLGIVKVNSTWYAFGEDKTGESSANTSFQDIPCYTSTDLRNWTYQSVALARQGSGDLGPNGPSAERYEQLVRGSCIADSSAHGPAWGRAPSARCRRCTHRAASRSSRAPDAMNCSHRHR